MFANSLLLCVFAVAPVEDTVADAAKESLAIIDTVVERHIDPPTRQELVCRFCRQLRAFKVPGLAREISAAATDEELLSIIAGHITEAGSEVDVTASLRGALAGIRFPVGLTTRSENAVSKQVAENRYVGTGIQLAMAPHPVMMKVFKNGPAWKAGAKDGDIIESIDGNTTKGMDILAVIKKLRGPVGSEVKVTLRQPRQESLRRKYTITRGVVPLTTIAEPTVSKSTAYVRLTSIGASTVHELRKIDSKLPDSVTRLVLDFRRIQNSNLHHGRLLANALLDEKPLGTVATPEKETTYATESGNLFGDFSLTILVDQTTSGTPEWIAAAVVDSGRGILAGKPTSGRGYVTEDVELNSSTVLEIPTALLRRSNGETLLDSAPKPTLPTGPRTGPLGRTRPFVRRVVPRVRIEQMTNLLEKSISESIQQP